MELRLALSHNCIGFILTLGLLVSWLLVSYLTFQSFPFDCFEAAIANLDKLLTLHE